jgi:hypothetical protein
MAKETGIAVFRVQLIFGLVFYLQACAVEPPFEWDDTFASPGTSLSVEVLETISGPPHGEVQLLIRPSGFSGPAANLTAWWKVGDEYYKFKPDIDADGTFGIWPEQYIRGQAVDIALVDETTNKRAHTKFTPFPITAEGDGGCKASAEVLTGSAQLWEITLTGYGAGEQVGTTSVLENETLNDVKTASATGEITVTIYYGPVSSRHVQYTAEGSSGCIVSLDYAIGSFAHQAK